MAANARAATSETVHATTISRDGRGLLILGASGRGKSGLALQLIAYGASLVADDRTEVFLRDDRVFARAPGSLAGLIEARGVGLLNAPTVPEVEVVLVADLDQTEPERLPPFRHIVILGQSLNLVLQSQNDHFPAALWLYLMQGRKG
jgi:HPr kinase/phosphorylase